MTSFASKMTSADPRPYRFPLVRCSLFILLFALFLNGCARAPKHLSSLNFAPYPISAPGAGVYHTVERGDTLYRISKNYRVEVSELMRVNRIDSPSQLVAGQRLFIPGQGVPVAPKPYEPVSIEKMRQI